MPGYTGATSAPRPSLDGAATHRPQDLLLQRWRRVENAWPKMLHY